MSRANPPCGTILHIPARRRRYPSDMALARQSKPDQSVNDEGLAARPIRRRPDPPGVALAGDARRAPGCPATRAARNCVFVILPLACAAATRRADYHSPPLVPKPFGSGRLNPRSNFGVIV